MNWLLGDKKGASMGGCFAGSRKSNFQDVYCC